jgi:hypothetical protein
MDALEIRVKKQLDADNPTAAFFEYREETGGSLSEYELYLESIGRASVGLEKVFLSRAWRMLQSEVDILLQLEDFNQTYKGAAPRLVKLLDAMEVIAKHAVVPLNEEVMTTEANLLKDE